MSLPPPPPGPLPPHANDDRGKAAVAVYWAQAAIAIIIVALRFYARILIRSLGADDWLMFSTLLIFIAMSILITYQSSLGGFKHIYSVTPANLPEVGKVNYMLQAWGLFSFVTGKAAVGYLILRVMGNRFVWQKWTIWVAIVLTLVLNSVNIVLTFVQCDPSRALWQKDIKAKCWDPKVQADFAFFVSAENTFVDVVLAVLPVTILWKLNMTFRNRMILCILLGLGLCAAICGIVKMTYLGSLTARSDITWETYNLVVWSGAETFVIIICGSVPPLKTLWSKYVSKSTLIGPDTRQRYGGGPDGERMAARMASDKDSSFASSKTGVSHVESEHRKDCMKKGGAREIHTVRDFEVSSAQMSV
ncbi:hypothetical protein EPUS_06026 [Endocarpon pusillum Z07020]|uniref:Rhodopsin domain-containing protein n=1 Tax=Endocarpon pusillum (strain Z07020 / HMAS-L-300199) TaxID=1263415 RepID=U1G1S5_ENDPU|nr:uncharacterized protein EPUS_06026 [Endocarpon pusillum Z07020]ERF71197.1 hypothetical protein EPUS_06026 [Endocarpon pusillum Z07020]